MPREAPLHRLRSVEGRDEGVHALLHAADGRERVDVEVLGVEVAEQEVVALVPALRRELGREAA